ncbi:PulJ/GspJ family protein [Eoetvoesiella caeni]|uniref:General secretion pathway protein J n=1 Tax=Eoetvoesiella caeni TaxID=645616 RepID=A0A366HB89_9BURK|nr:prepilin-type N-terminal cleavage/methylation domain-containing protein [Eoetvoesiella caeni]MCI2809621.1 prepilin-type N-terminal cleavage/methylation domain-containing protein [Eoetvoesiella caeni]NYT56117.1 prepilin-type N-terminal cleavage/methylation domain-containing protein [Eoetvoesiella caeni]RBP38882.1 general secretion pathway protein J [Eoetvoesiella caeni]
MMPTVVKQQGFTLIEVLVALALMAVLSIVSWQALDMVERSSERLNASADDTLALVRVLGQIESDLSHHANSDILPSPSQVTPAATLDTMLPAGIQWAPPVLTVVRSARDGAWQRVAWGQDGNTLRRAVGPAAQTLPLPQAGSSDVVLDQVKNFSVRAWIPGQGWSTPNEAATQAKATGLEIMIERMHHGASEVYRKVVLLP